MTLGEPLQRNQVPRCRSERRPAARLSTPHCLSRGPSSSTGLGRRPTEQQLAEHAVKGLD
eukprot:5973288-Alexandrium_andersonii.AAC.1